MGYIHDRSELRTGCQEIEAWSPAIDLQCDFVMVYGIDKTMTQRIQQFREKGYVVHLMTGCSWGDYQDYLSGEWDGCTHWDESQTARDGKPVLHGVDVPYMVPTISFAKYLTQKLMVAVDTGVEGIHLEEPEFWDNAGYSKAFQKEYADYYQQEWAPPHSSVDARYRCSKLKAYLYARAVGYISAKLKDYAKTTYGRDLKFYVPTHSLVNYTQWKILSPEGALIDIPTVDGYIAQVWTGTSGTGNVYQGHYGSSTFETAFLEYGIMQELVKKTGRTMWFLHDPVEDFPEYTWDVYKKNYLKTVVASLFHPMISRYEICPWPNRVFNGVYPRKLGMAGGMIPTTDMEGAQEIPREYSTLLSSMVQLLGDMEQTEFTFDEVDFGVGVLMSDSCLYQRSMPDSVQNSAGDTYGMSGGEESINNKLLELSRLEKQGENIEEENRRFMDEINSNEKMLYGYAASCAFPNFFGMTLPLLKYGLPVRPVQLENSIRFSDFLDDYKHLILSYEYMKPENAATNLALVNWVKNGGNLIYIGDGSDPYHRVEAWWNEQKESYANPAEHLFLHLGLSRTPNTGIYPAGKGQVAVYSLAPAKLTLRAEAAEDFRGFIKKALEQRDCTWKDSNHLLMRRGPYVIGAVMTQSASSEPLTCNGLYVDLLRESYPIITSKTIFPDQNMILFDFSKIEDEKSRIVGSSARVIRMECDDKGMCMEMKAAAKINVSVRIRLPKKITKLWAVTQAGEDIPIQWEWDSSSRTVLMNCESNNEIITVEGIFE